jgi:hypothetical protein
MSTRYFIASAAILTGVGVATPSTSLAYTQSSRLANPFEGTVYSRLAVAIGAAEGTRTTDGGKTSAYYGHVDPGNGVWNWGSFSFQHCAEARYRCASQWEADIYQLRRIQSFAWDYLRNYELTELEFVNAADLFNQAPLAAYDFMQWLEHAKSKGLVGEKAIHYARVMSFTNKWGNLDAPGLGNSWERVRADQQRRMDRIAEVLTDYTPPDGVVTWRKDG